MKKSIRLRIVLSLLVVLVSSSCSEQPDDISVNKEEIIGALMEEFSTNIVNSESYNNLLISLDELGLESGRTLEEIVVTEELIQEFLNSQSQEFLYLYNAVLELNISGEEFLEIADSFDFPVSNSSNGRTECWICNEKACAVSTAITKTPCVNGCGLLGYIGVAIHCLEAN